MRTELLRALRRRSTAGTSGGFWAVWLVLCLLLAQHAGLVHRIQHGSYGALPAGPVSASLASPNSPATTAAAHEITSRIGRGAELHAPDSARSASHSCVLFDGATQADGVCALPPMPLLSHGKPLVPPGITWRWPHLPPQRSFLTRAPPSSLASS